MYPLREVRQQLEAVRGPQTPITSFTEGVVDRYPPTFDDILDKNGNKVTFVTRPKKTGEPKLTLQEKIVMAISFGLIRPEWD